MTASQGPERLKQRYDICVTGVLEVEEKENGGKSAQRNKGWLFSNLVKDVLIDSRNWVNPKQKSIPRHIIIKFMKAETKEKS